MSDLWTHKEAAAATGGMARGAWAVSGISIDTRTLETGDLFVALEDQRDGHDFVAQALSSGAAAALVSRVPEDVAPDAPLLVVDDVLAALQDLARAARARMTGRVIAVTGSVGKTTCKDMLQKVLASQGRVHAAEMSLNNHWGVPLTLARMPRDAEFAVIEIGMNHAREITPLSQLARPHVAMITTVAEAHMAAFNSIEDIAKAKSEIFAGLEPDGVAVLNGDIATFDILRKAAGDVGAKIRVFGSADAADYQMLDAISENNITVVQAKIDGENALFKIGAAGRHFALNGLAVLASLEAAGADPVVAALDLARWHPPAGRGARHWIALDPIKQELRLELIDDSYNANPASMRAALEVLAAAQPVHGLGRNGKGRRIAFLSDMLELGEDGAEIHAALADLNTMDAVDIVHCTGPLMRHLNMALPMDKQGEWFEQPADLAAQVHKVLNAGDVVMVKGSKGSKASLVVDAIKKLGQSRAKS